LRPSSARNIVERGFGQLKRRFPILDHLPNYPHDMQILIIYLCFSLFNLIKLYGTDAEYDMDPDHKERGAEGAASIRRPADSEAAKRFMDEIAEGGGDVGTIQILQVFGYRTGDPRAICTCLKPPVLILINR
jgi:hypothetical protein